MVKDTTQQTVHQLYRSVCSRRLALLCRDKSEALTTDQDIKAVLSPTSQTTLLACYIQYFIHFISIWSFLRNSWEKERSHLSAMVISAPAAAAAAGDKLVSEEMKKAMEPHVQNQKIRTQMKLNHVWTPCLCDFPATRFLFFCILLPCMNSMMFLIWVVLAPMAQSLLYDVLLMKASFFWFWW